MDTRHFIKVILQTTSGSYEKNTLEFRKLKRFIFFKSGTQKNWKDSDSGGFLGLGLLFFFMCSLPNKAFL